MPPAKEEKAALLRGCTIKFLFNFFLAACVPNLLLNPGIYELLTRRLRLRTSWEAVGPPDVQTGLKTYPPVPAGNGVAQESDQGTTWLECRKGNRPLALHQCSTFLFVSPEGLQQALPRLTGPPHRLPSGHRKITIPPKSSIDLNWWPSLRKNKGFITWVTRFFLSQYS